MKIKICGITNKEDADNAISLGVDAIGFIFAENSQRTISLEKAEDISIFLPPFVSRGGVFVNQPLDYVHDISDRCNLDYVQLHGEESPDYCIQCKKKLIKVFRVNEEKDLDSIEKYQGIVSALLLDTKVKDVYGGSGQVFDWGLAISAKEYHLPLILSGGINSSNIHKAIQLVNPYAIDISSGVESSPGEKDYHKMESVINIVHGV